MDVGGKVCAGTRRECCVVAVSEGREIATSAMQSVDPPSRCTMSNHKLEPQTRSTIVVSRQSPGEGVF